MSNYAKWYLGIVILLGQAFVSYADDDCLIIPGQQVGSIKLNDSLSSVRKHIGKHNMLVEEIPLDEDTHLKHVTVYPENEEKQLVLQLDENERVEAIIIDRVTEDEVPCYHNKEGIVIGLTLRDIEKMNGKPFKLTGFDWDFQGTVSSWEDGHLENVMRGLAVRLLPDADDKYSEIVGEEIFMSSHPEMQQVNPTVNHIEVYKYKAKRQTQVSH
ncbi:hypothetical protein KCM76_08455 [Zooshikella marina]|uniref:hypothetical protein n=1 Tax=Zooshikella ganghwensis TaxID=202772 RepID=UPI001BAF53DC|nr:hypothetical protein [Zooshikella ganghwensis]MBU2706012.1 hypothetical protein [Zooshikella ganghwensis]